MYLNSTVVVLVVSVSLVNISCSRKDDANEINRYMMSNDDREDAPQGFSLEVLYCVLAALLKYNRHCLYVDYYYAYFVLLNFTSEDKFRNIVYLYARRGKKN